MQSILFDTLLSADRSARHLAGEVVRERQRWENPDGSATVVVELLGGTVARGKLEPGEELLEGVEYRLLGKWVEHPRYGWQFAFDSLVSEAPPAEPRALCRYLARHCSGVGPVTAAKLVEAYGSEAARVVATDPARVAADGHLSVEDAGQAALDLIDVGDPALRDAHLDLHSLIDGLGWQSRALKAALKKWGLRAPALLRRDPFLALTSRLPGCGFLRCDKLYRRMGLPLGKLKRQALAAWYALDRLDGHTWAPFAEALAAIRAQVGLAGSKERRALALLCRARGCELHLTDAGEVWIAERDKARAERQLALDVKRLMGPRPDWPAVEASADAFPPHPYARLSDHQRERLGAAMTSPVVILTGSPGTGKTYVAAALIEAVTWASGSGGIAVCAPTGKAAVRISEKLAEAGLGLRASTIHRLVGVSRQDDGQLAFGDEQLPVRLVVVDETSMCDTSLLCALFRVLPTGCHVLLVGDPHQLPPVGHGAPLRDLLEAGVPCARLEEIKRQESTAGMGIVHACKAIKGGKAPKLADRVEAYPGTDLVQLPPAKGEKGRVEPGLLCDQIGRLLDWCREKGFDPVEKCQVICARNATRETLNDYLRPRLNPDARGEGRLRVGDKVICLKNGLYGRVVGARTEGEVYVSNGDMGRVEESHARHLIVRLGQPDRLVSVPMGRQEEDHPAGEGPGPGAWDLAYAVTCHKYQGSECPVVVVVAEPAGKLGCREWIYTAISRARELCLLVADGRDLTAYVRKESLPERKTMLTELLGSGHA